MNMFSEHIMMALIEQPNDTLKTLFREYSITSDSFAKCIGYGTGQYARYKRQPGIHLRRTEKIRL